MDICIKNVDSEDWLYFKTEAVKNKLKTSEMFSKLVKEHQEKSKEGNWKNIVYSDRVLSNGAAMSIKESMKDFRKEYDF